MPSIFPFKEERGETTPVASIPHPRSAIRADGPIRRALAVSKVSSQLFKKTTNGSVKRELLEADSERKRIALDNGHPNGYAGAPTVVHAPLGRPLTIALHPPPPSPTPLQPFLHARHP